MTRVNFSFTKHIFTAEFDGHAGFAAAGADVVCAAASVLGYTLLQRLIDQKPRLRDVCYEIEDGHLCISVAYDDITLIAETVKTISTGLRMLEREYPSHIKIFFKKEKTGEKSKTSV